VDSREFFCPACNRTWPYEAVTKVPCMKRKKCICEECASPVPEFNHFGGSTYDPGRDKTRLSKQQAAVIEVMRCGDWFTIPQVAEAIGAPAESLNAIGARIRDIRKIYNNPNAVERRHVGGGLWEYRFKVSEGVR
jgi:hypothetical protein